MGEQVASTIDVKAGDTITISQLDASASSKAAAQSGRRPRPQRSIRTVTLTVSGILKTGGNEDGYVYMSTSDMDALTEFVAPCRSPVLDHPGRRTAQRRCRRDERRTPTFTPRPCRLAQSDAGVLTMLRSCSIVITVIVHWH